MLVFLSKAIFAICSTSNFIKFLLHLCSNLFICTPYFFDCISHSGSVNNVQDSKGICNILENGEYMFKIMLAGQLYSCLGWPAHEQLVICFLQHPWPYLHCYNWPLPLTCNNIVSLIPVYFHLVRSIYKDISLVVETKEIIRLAKIGKSFSCFLFHRPYSPTTFSHYFQLPIPISNRKQHILLACPPCCWFQIELINLPFLHQWLEFKLG